MAKRGDSEQTGSKESGRKPYVEPVLRALGALRELTFKSGENPKATAREKAIDKVGGQ